MSDWRRTLSRCFDSFGTAAVSDSLRFFLLASPPAALWTPAPAAAPSSSSFLRLVGLRFAPPAAAPPAGAEADEAAAAATPILAAASRRRNGRQMAHDWSGHSLWWRMRRLERAHRGYLHVSPARHCRVWLVTRAFVGAHSGTVQFDDGPGRGSGLRFWGLGLGFGLGFGLLGLGLCLWCRFGLGVE